MGAANPNLRLDMLREDQTLRWQQGDRVPVEEYLQVHPDLSDEDALILIVGELLLRWELGERPRIEEYQQRLPKYAEQIAFQFSLNESIDGDSSEDLNGDLQPTPISTPDLLDVGDSRQVIAGFELGSELGRSESGIVYHATNQSLQRAVALKILTEQAVADPKLAAKFADRGRVIVKLDHPHLVRIHQAGRFGNKLFVAMDYCDNGSLRDRFQVHHLNQTEILQAVENLAQAAAYAHDRGIVLGHIHAGNVLYGRDGRPKLTDFAALPQPLPHTPNQEPEPASDIYQLGVVLYEGLTNRHPEQPYSGSVRRYNPEVSAELATVIERCLDPRPHRRYATAEALAADLRRLRYHEPLAALPDRSQPWPWLIILGCILIGILLVGLVWFLLQ